MTLPPDYPHRRELNDEVHARPPERLVAPLRISYLALMTDPAASQAGWESVRALAASCGVLPPGADQNHFSADLGAFRMKSERHGEFTRHKFIVAGPEKSPFAEPALQAIPRDWLAALPGRLLTSAHLVLQKADEGDSDYDAISTRSFSGNELVGSRVGSGAARAFTDFRIHADGFSRFLVQDISLTPRQAGRTVQRLLEMETYRMLALLALPLARELVPFLTENERELSQIAAMMVRADSSAERDLLTRLTQVEAGIESRYAENLFRFGAAAAYREIVARRICELREERIQGLQTCGEFMERRFAPAMNTCRSAVARQEALSARVSRTTHLLSTKVAVAVEQQNQAVLASMDRRAKLQLRLQQTVEGLSIAAVTYYVVGLVGYGSKALHSVGFPINPELMMGASIPVVALLAAFGLSRVHRSVAEHG